MFLQSCSKLSCRAGGEIWFTISHREEHLQNLKCIPCIAVTLYIKHWMFEQWGISSSTCARKMHHAHSHFRFHSCSWQKKGGRKRKKTQLHYPHPKIAHIAALILSFKLYNRWTKCSEHNDRKQGSIKMCMHITFTVLWKLKAELREGIWVIWVCNSVLIYITLELALSFFHWLNTMFCFSPFTFSVVWLSHALAAPYVSGLQSSNCAIVNLMVV